MEEVWKTTFDFRTFYSSPIGTIAHQKGQRLGAQRQALSPQRAQGHKRSIVALEHKMLRTVYAMLSQNWALSR